MQTTKYHKVADIIRRRLDAGDYPVGTPIPSLQELMVDPEIVRIGGASRHTVREGVGVLEREGRVVRKIGVGTIVRDASESVDTYTPDSPSQEWEHQHPDGRDVLVAAEWTTADTDTAVRLAIEPGARVVRRVRHQTKGASIVKWFETWVPGTHADAIKDATGYDLTDIETEQPANLFELLTSAGHPPVETTEMWRSRDALPEEADILEIPEGMRVMAGVRVTVDAAGPVETTNIVGAGDRFSVCYTVPLNYAATPATS